MNTALDQTDLEPTTIEPREPWQAPELVFLGRLGDLVRGGGGKSVGAFDSDPNGDQFPPGQEK